MIKPGLFAHYKGDHYRVLFIAKDSTNGPDEDQDMVVYVSLKAPGRISVRTEKEFDSDVIDGSAQCKRFIRLGD